MSVPWRQQHKYYLDFYIIIIIIIIYNITISIILLPYGIYKLP